MRKKLILTYLNKFRLIIDLQILNTHCNVPSFKYEDVNTVIEQVKQDDLKIAVDLKNGFQHILVHKQDRDLLGFT